MSKIFKIRNTDKRQQLINKTLRTTQKVRGKDVEYFSLDTGFVLLEKDSPVRWNQVFVKRAIAAAKLSLGVPLELREFYYTLGGDPDLVKHFEGVQAKNLYTEVLRAISNLEILADVGRERFVVGNLSKGFIYYFHSEKYSDKDRKIAFTEKIARSVMTDDELEACENIIVIEKNASATRLVSLQMSELTNSVVVTVGGNFNRAIWELVKRFNGTKNIIVIADGDVYGVDMLRTIKVGTESSRHLDYKFPPGKYPRIFLAGLYPSIAEELGIPNDKESKRPSQRPATRKRIEFLQRHGLVDHRDVVTWLDHDNTYELEALAAFFKNRKGEPIGLAIYVVEFMRLFNIAVKPPLPPDKELKEQFDEAARVELKEEIINKISLPKVFWTMYWMFDTSKNELQGDIFEELKDDYEAVLQKVTAKEIKYHIYKQLEEDPTRATYDLRAIAHKLKKEFDISIDWSLGDWKDKFEEFIKEYKKEGPDFETDVVFEPIHNEERVDFNAYDMVLRQLGADMEDCNKVRAALRKRFDK